MECKICLVSMLLKVNKGKILILKKILDIKVFEPLTWNKLCSVSENSEKNEI